MGKALRQRLKEQRAGRALAEAEAANVRDAFIQAVKLIPTKWITFTKKADRRQNTELVDALKKRSGAAFLSEVYRMQARRDQLAEFADKVGGWLCLNNLPAEDQVEGILSEWEALKEALS